MDNQLTQGNLNGRHLMTIFAMDSWAEYDEDWKFEDSFEKFMTDYNEVFKNSWEENLMVNKEICNTL